MHHVVLGHCFFAFVLHKKRLGGGSSNLWLMLTFTFEHMKSRCRSSVLSRRMYQCIGGARDLKWDVQTWIC